MYLEQLQDQISKSIRERYVQIWIRISSIIAHLYGRGYVDASTSAVATPRESLSNMELLCLNLQVPHTLSRTESQQRSPYPLKSLHVGL
jgi:hypothetical protein